MLLFVFDHACNLKLEHYYIGNGYHMVMKSVGFLVIELARGCFV